MPDLSQCSTRARNTLCWTKNKPLILEHAATQPPGCSGLALLLGPHHPPGVRWSTRDWQFQTVKGLCMAPCQSELPRLVSLQQVHIPLVLGPPELTTVLPVGSQGSGVEGRFQLWGKNRQLAAPHSYHVSIPLQRTPFNHELLDFRNKFHFPCFYPSFDSS